MWSAFRKTFGVNALILRVDNLWTRLEAYTAEQGKSYRLVALAPKYLSSPRLLKWLSHFDTHTPQSPAAERFRVSENSKLLYYSPEASYYYPKTRFPELFLGPLALTIGFEWTAVIAYGIYLVGMQPYIYSLSRHLVVRMDLLPSQEAILFHKVGLFGMPRTELVPISNLQKMEPLHSKFQLYFRSMNVCDPQLLFRDTRTLLEYGFDRNGIWLDENLKHELIA